MSYLLLVPVVLGLCIWWIPDLPPGGLLGIIRGGRPQEERISGEGGVWLRIGVLDMR